MTDTTIEHLLPQTALTPDAEALRAGDTRLSWSQLEARANRVFHCLAGAGLANGDRWAILATNRPEWAELVLGNARAGTHYVPLNWHLTPGELAYLIEDSGSRLLVVDPAHEAAGRKAAAAAGGDVEVVVLGPIYETWLEDAPSTPSADGPAGNPLLYTGGTTGRSKGVIRPDLARQVSQWAAASSAWGEFVGIPPGGSCLVTTPMYHGFGYGALAAGLARGNRVVLHQRFDPETFLRAIEEERITTAPLVPTQMVRLAKLDPEVRGRYDLSSLQHVVHGAAPCPDWAKRALIDWWGPILVEFYGSSEGTGPVVATSQDWLERPGTVGRPNPTLTASVVGEDGRDLPPDTIGTLYFRRTDGLPQYHGDPEKTASILLPDGRFTVGDLGWMDDDGYLYLADRRVDLIVSGGVNIYPAEIEGVLIGHPAVRDAAVFGIPDPEWGQQVKAVVELEPSAPVAMDELEDDLLAWCLQHLAPFKCPRSVDVHDSLPRDESGKLRKHLLRDAFRD